MSGVVTSDKCPDLNAELLEAMMDSGKQKYVSSIQTMCLTDHHLEATRFSINVWVYCTSVSLYLYPSCLHPLKLLLFLCGSPFVLSLQQLPCSMAQSGHKDESPEFSIRTLISIPNWLS